MEQINLNIIPDGVMPVCHASQFDRDRTIRFNLTENGAAYTLAGTETIKCKIKKPDNTENVIDVTNTSSTYVEVVFGYDDLDVSGDAMCELVFDGSDISGSRNFLLRIEADAYDGSVFEERSASGAIASFETNFIDNLTECIVDIDAVQAGSGTPSPTNVRAISGWSECNVTKCGKNLCNFFNDGKVPSVNNGILINYYGCRTGYIKAKPSSSYTLSATSSASPNFYIFCYDKDYNFLIFSNGNAPLTITTPSDCCYIMLRNDSALSTIVNAQLELGSTATEYEAFNRGTDTISLGQTVYGGTLNVSTGVLTITHGFVDLGTQTWFSGGGSFYDTADIGAESSTMDIIATSYPCESSAYFENHTDIVGLSISASRKVRFYNSDATSPSDVQTLLNGCYLCYKLATPTTATLTPTEVRTLLNDNNIFADTGNIEVKYLIEVV